MFMRYIASLLLSLLLTAIAPFAVGQSQTTMNNVDDQEVFLDESWDTDVEEAFLDQSWDMEDEGAFLDQSWDMEDEGAFLDQWE